MNLTLLNRLKNTAGTVVVLLMLTALLLGACGEAPEAPADATEPAADATEPADTAEDEATEPAADATEPADTAEDEATEPADEEPASGAAEGETTNDAGGFAFEVPEGWEVLSNEGLPSLGGIVMMVPEGTDIETENAPLIFLQAGDLETFINLTETDMSLDDVSLDELLDASLPTEEDESDVTVSEREEIEVDGNEGIAANVSGSDPELGDIEGRMAIVKVGADRLFQLLSTAPADEWNQEPVNTVLDSVTFFEPVPMDLEDLELPELDGTALPDDLQLPEQTDTMTETSSFFPLPPSAENVMDLSTSEDTPQISYQTSLTLEEAMNFYRDELTPEGATEREILTVVEGDTFNLVFDNWTEASDRAVVIQGVKLTDGLTNVTVRLEEV